MRLVAKRRLRLVERALRIWLGLALLVGPAQQIALAAPSPGLAAAPSAPAPLAQTSGTASPTATTSIAGTTPAPSATWTPSAVATLAASATATTSTAANATAQTGSATPAGSGTPAQRLATATATATATASIGLTASPTRTAGGSATATLAATATGTVMASPAGSTTATTTATVTATATGTVSGLPAGPGRIKTGGTYADPPPLLGVATESVVTPGEGGSVTSDDGTLTLQFWPGAVSEAVRVRIQRRAVPSWASVPQAFFWADMTATKVSTGEAVHAFGVPALATLAVAPAVLTQAASTSRLLPEDLRWWQYDETSERWVPQAAGYDAGGGVLRVRLEHFSNGAAGLDPNAQPSTPPSMANYGTDLFTGWPTLSYPIAVPPGTAGMAPAVGLSYFGGTVDLTQNVTPTPAAQADWTGYGWQLEPGSIVRTAPGQESFTLNLAGRGGKLLYDQTSDTYHTDPERFLRIKKQTRTATLADGSQWQTEYWVATDKDGTQYRFGYDVPADVAGVSCSGFPASGPCTTSGSIEWMVLDPGGAWVRQATRYHLDQIADTRGNQVTFSYDLATANVLSGTLGQTPVAYVRAGYLRRITYTLHPAGPDITGRRQVVFDRDTRVLNGTKDFETDAEYDVRRGAGFAVRSQRFFADQRLSRVSTWICASACTVNNPPTAPWQEVARWDLAHSYMTIGTVQNTGDSYMNRLQLVSITPKDAGGVNALPATSFAYDANNGGIINQVLNGYGGIVSYAYQTYSNGAGGTYRRVASRTVGSGMANGGQAEQYQTTYAYTQPATSFVLDNTPGHAQVDETDSVGVIHHEFNTAPQSTSPLRPGTRGTQSKQSLRNGSGAGAGVQVWSWSVATAAASPDPIHIARLDSQEQWSSEAGSRQVSHTDYTYDQYGNVTQVVEQGDTGVTGDERTTTRAYAYNTSTYIVGLPSTEVLYNGPSTGSTALRETRLSYDGQAWGAAPTKGLLTLALQLDRQNNANQEATAYVYDATYGNRLQTLALANPAGNNPNDPNNPVTTVAYDATYQTFPVTTTVKTTEAATLATTRSFDAGRGLLLSESDPNGAATTYAYDTFGRLTEIWRPGDATTGPATTAYAYAYTGAPNRLTRTDNDGSADGGHFTEQFYDGLGRLVETKQELADSSAALNSGVHSVVRRLYNARDLVTTEYVPWQTPAESSADFLTKFEPVETAGQPATTTTYDFAGRVTKVTHPDDTVSLPSAAQMAYGDPPSAGVGRTRTITDENGHVRVEYSDGYGRLRRVDENNGAAGTATTTYTYNAFDALLTVQDAVGNGTTVGYDNLGRKTTLTDPDAGSWQYVYDGLGRLARQQDAKSQNLRFTYDLAGRLTLKEGATSAAGPYQTLAAYSYDQTGAQYGAGLGRRTSMSDASGSTTWQYDSRGRVTQLDQTILGTTYTTGYAYDSLDRQTSVSYPSVGTTAAEVVSTAYGAHGQPVSLTGTTPYVSGATYSALFQPLGWTYGNQVRASFDYYDTANELDHSGGQTQPRDYRLHTISYSVPSGVGACLTGSACVLQEHDYDYDRAGNVTKWWQTDSLGLLRTWTYQYDPRDRLTNATVTGPLLPPLTQPASVGARPRNGTAGGQVTVMWSDVASPSAGDWVGLYAPGAADTAPLAKKYIDRTTSVAGDCATQKPAVAPPLASGECRFTIPAGTAAGRYELRLFRNDTYTRLATSTPLYVTAAAGTTLGASPPRVAPGGSSTVEWAGIASPHLGDWIGLYDVTGPSDKGTGADGDIVVGSTAGWPNGTSLADGTTVNGRNFTLPAGYTLYVNGVVTIKATGTIQIDGAINGVGRGYGGG